MSSTNSTKEVISQYVRCPNCYKYNTHLVKISNTYYIECHSCNSMDIMNKIDYGIISQNTRTQSTHMN